MKEFKGKVAVITGAASGIGYGLAERCAQEGMKVVLAGINENTLTQAEKDLKKAGATTLVVKTDVSQAKDVEALAKKTLDAFGAVHLLFNNAGVYVIRSVWESTLNDWQWVLGVNLWGVIHGLHYFTPIMLKQGDECHIVNTASSEALMVVGSNCLYAVSKHAVIALSEALYRELEYKKSNIGVSVMCPWITNTRVLESERNRPLSLENKPGEGQNLDDPVVKELSDMFTQMVKNGMSPKKVADITFNAIREKKFYILLNADMVRPMVQARMEDILQERNPTAVVVNLK